MAINPDYWMKARDEAPIHVQIRLDRRPTPDVDSLVGGPIVRIFRDGTTRLSRGDILTFEIKLWNGRPDGPPMPGRQFVGLEWEWIRKARYVEAYLDEFEGRYTLCWDQATALMRPTNSPVNPPGGTNPYGVLVTDEILHSAERSDEKLWSRIFRWFRSK